MPTLDSPSSISDDGVTRVLFITDKLVTGGVETVLLGILRALSDPSCASGLELSLLLPCPGGELEEKLPPSIAKRYIHKRDPRGTWLGRCWYYGLQLWTPGWLNSRFLVRGQYDVVVAYKASMAGHLRGLPARRICYVHNVLEDVGPVARVPMYRALRAVDTVVCVSEGIRRDVEARTGRTSGVEVLRNPIDCEAIRSRAEEPVSELKPDRFLIVSVGRLERVKRFDRLVEVARMLRDDGWDFEVWIIGDGSQMAELQSQIRTHGLDGRVRVLGRKENPFPYMRMAELFVMTTAGEGYATVLTEALAVGVPVISTNVVGTDEPLGGGRYGRLTGESNEDLYAAISDCMASDTALRDLQIRAESAAEVLDKESAIESLKQVLNPQGHFTFRQHS